MNEFNLLLGLFVVFVIAVGVFSLVIWGGMLLFYMEKIDQYFDSPDFLHRGVKGLWPWEMGRAASYGVFILFHNSRFVRKKLPYARENINIDELPKKIKFMVLFPMYTCIPAALFILAGGSFLYINKWFF
ncbi:hypothetical protein [Vreelandella olivaria]|uniref:hypothetical protein n=1 Tax=Vreelandella olivaria TaxID=390919 RepID=UPI00201EB102|nr:hypothetical protein [Halomonas olivaria]